MGLEDGAKVYLSSSTGVIDTVRIKDHNFKFKNPNISKNGLYILTAKGKKGRYDYPLFLKENSVLIINADSTFTGLKISGDKNSTEQNVFYLGKKMLDAKRLKLDSMITATNDPDKLLILKEQRTEVINQISNHDYNWVLQHRSSQFSVAIIRLYIANNPPTEREDTLGEKIYSFVLPSAKKNNDEAEILENGFSFSNSKYAKLREGSLLPEFLLIDTSGKMFSFQSTKNKILLIDFWASWCGPCRENNPELKDLYATYKDKGLEVISISMDTDKTKWKEAIKKDELSWTQLSDLKGQDAGVGGTYRIWAVPTYILVGPDRRIILKSIGGDVDMVSKKLDEIFGN
ncbi:MAG: AhpC/TSA family protein [Bacteroidetes bacterium]|nr:AhpC/TSA family protein [Bacteroidota bacterium]